MCPRGRAQACVCRCWIESSGTLKIRYCVAVVTDPERIDQSRAKDVGLLQSHYLSSGLGSHQCVVQNIGGGERCSVVGEGPEQTVLVRNLVIDPDCKVIFLHRQVGRSQKAPRISTGIKGSIRQWVEGQVLC